mmetsp:Transcript_31947/g.89894  ORF Transcript_31947/g.89894 Transcript_31947/m.89894 type:complete len:112 (-) Transcript_31947:145-480(-)
MSQHLRGQVSGHTRARCMRPSRWRERKGALGWAKLCTEAGGRITAFRRCSRPHGASRTGPLGRISLLTVPTFAHLLPFAGFEKGKDQVQSGGLGDLSLLLPENDQPDQLRW